jgi:predicted HAD superfamily Cof-like phosphohydrolase
MTEEYISPLKGLDKLVLEFNTVFESSTSLDLWVSLVDEESKEVLEALALELAEDTLESHTNVLKEACDLVYVMTGLSWALGKHGLAPEGPLLTEVSEMTGLLLEVYGEDVFIEAFKRVHESNMSKLGDDGKPVRREDGKVLKGPNYKPPVLTDLAVKSYLKAAA